MFRLQQKVILKKLNEIYKKCKTICRIKMIDEKLLSPSKFFFTSEVGRHLVVIKSSN